MQQCNNNERIRDTNNFGFTEAFYILKKYIGSILFITILFSLMTYSYLYFKPKQYNAYSIIKVNSTLISNNSEDIINNTKSKDNIQDVTEDISLLKTFQTNKDAIDKINFKVQYFKEEEYKKIEIYHKLPLEITKIKIINRDIIGKLLKIVPRNGGFSIEYNLSYKEKLLHKFFKTKLFTVDDTNQTFNYGESLKTSYFRIKVDKKEEIKKPIYFILQGDKRDFFENIIKNKLNVVQLEKDTSLIKITYQDNIPNKAKLYVKTLTHNFIEQSIENKNKQNYTTLTFIKKELKNIKEELKNSEKELEKYQVLKTIVKPSDRATLYIKELSNIEVEIAENNLKTQLIKNLIKFVKNNYNLDSIAPSISRLNDSNTLKLINTLQTYQIKEESFMEEYTDQHPKLKSLRREIQKIRNKISLNLNNIHSSIKYKTRSLLQQKKDYEENLKVLPSQERKLVNIKRNYEVKARMYEYLLKKESESTITQLATFSDYKIIDEAYTSYRPIKSKFIISMVLSVIFGLIVGILVAFIRNALDSKIKNEEDIKKLTTLPIYGSIPFYKQKKYQLKVATDPRSPFAEGFRTLRTNLQFTKKSDKATTILITSTIASEGKTTISANLAKVLEMAQYKTLLINLDIRKPTLHHFFDIDNSIGISNYLDGQCSEMEIIRHTEFGTLDIITSGPIPENPSELILSKRLPILFEKLKTMYDYIIIDTAPIGIVTDTKSIMKHTDLNLILLKENFAKKEFITTIEKMIIQYQFENVGFILNASSNIGGEYGYGYSYEYK